jgi:hypothetical protein
MVWVGLEVLIKEVGQPESDQEAQDQRDVIDTFVSEVEGGRHGGAPTRRGEKRRCTAEESPEEDPGGIYVNMHKLKEIDKDIIRGKLYTRSTKEG